MAYVNADLLLESRERYVVDLVGPVRRNWAWQAREGKGFDVSRFEIDWENRVATCPQGKKSKSWVPGSKGARRVVWIKFSGLDCGTYPSQRQCLRSPGRRKDGSNSRISLTVVSKEHHDALETARKREDNLAYAREYFRRGGIEGTVSRAVRTCGIRASRYRGLERTRLQHLFTATAVNYVRSSAWLAEKPRAPVRRSSFRKLVA